MTKKEHTNGRVLKKSRKHPNGNTASTHQSLWSNLLQYDKQCSQRCSICASSEASWGAFRPLMKALEISGHGIPWFTISTAVLYQAYLSKNSAVFNPSANLLLGLLLDIIVSFVLKGTVRRPRPAANNADMFFTVSVDSYSFPSGHCTRAAFIFYFFVTTFELPSLFVISLLLWMSAICVSRVLLGRHYWSDVISGAIIGILQGAVIQRHWKTWELVEQL